MPHRPQAAVILRGMSSHHGQPMLHAPLSHGAKVLRRGQGGWHGDRIAEIHGKPPAASLPENRGDDRGSGHCSQSKRTGRHVERAKIGAHRNGGRRGDVARDDEAVAGSEKVIRTSQISGHETIRDPSQPDRAIHRRISDVDRRMRIPKTGERSCRDSMRPKHESQHRHVREMHDGEHDGRTGFVQLSYGCQSRYCHPPLPSRLEQPVGPGCGQHHVALVHEMPAGREQSRAAGPHGRECSPPVPAVVPESPAEGKERNVRPSSRGQQRRRQAVLKPTSNLQFGF